MTESIKDKLCIMTLMLTLRYYHMTQIKSNQLVSAIITTHNRFNLLNRAVNSVLSQTYPDIELIVVDDGSTDETQSWCESQNFKYIRIPVGKSRGGNYARNLGLYSAKGVFVAYLDDDDSWMPTKIEKQVNALLKSGNELVHCYRNLEIIDSNGNSNIELCPLTSNYSGNLNKRILYQITCLTSSIMVKRDALLSVGGFDENLKCWQEYELTIRLAQRKPFDLVPEFLLSYRIDHCDANRLTNKYDGWKKSVHYIYDKHKSLYRQLDIISQIRVKLLYLRDSAVRAKASGLNSLYIKHHSIEYILNIPFRIFDKLKTII